MKEYMGTSCNFTEQLQNESQKEVVLDGLAISDGVAIGHIFVLPQEQLPSVSVSSIGPEQIHSEIWKYRRALVSSREDLERLQLFLARDASDPQAVGIIETHIQMLSDPLLTQLVEEKIENMQFSSEFAFCSIMQEVEQMLKQKEPFFAARASDVRDISLRILHYLSGSCYLASHFQHLPPSAIAVSREFVPTHAAESESRIKAFISEHGADTSHVALIARAKNIPYISGLSFEKMSFYHGAQVIVDGFSGKVIIHPTHENLCYYHTKKQEHKRKQTEAFLQMASFFKARDKVEILANIDSLEDVAKLSACTIPGVGLCRTEFLFLNRDLQALVEKEQVKVYLDILSHAGQREFVFRLFDFGSDKPFALSEMKEINPALGLRSIRYLLEKPEILKRQLRAILQVSKGRNIKLLIPLVTDVHEIEQTRMLMDIALDELKKEGIVDISPLPIGAMIEAPGAAIMIDKIAHAVDFVSIGSNDLAQYTLVADRTNPSMAHYYQYLHPSLVRLILKIILECKRQKKPLSICGEIASNPLFIPLLLGLGLKKLSCGMKNLSKVCKQVQSLNLQKCKILAKAVLEVDSSAKIHRLLTEFLQKS